jgi:hypothetical protein
MVINVLDLDMELRAQIIKCLLDAVLEVRG